MENNETNIPNIWNAIALRALRTGAHIPFTSPTVRDESHDASWGRIVEVLP